VAAPTTSYSNTGLSPSTAYSYAVVAYDAAGNVSSQSNVATATTPDSGGSGSSLTVNGAQRFQTMDGFGVSVNSASWKNGELRPAIDILVDQLGATLFRVIIDNADWEATNDNADHNTFNWTYYNGVYTTSKFENLWSTMSYLNQKGVTSGIMLNFMGPVANWMGGTNINTSAEDEWVEMIASVVFYAKNDRGLNFTLLAPMNEPAWDGIEGPLVWEVQYTRLMEKLAAKLDSIGLSDVRLVGPDTAGSIGGFTPFFYELAGNPSVMAKLDHFAFHDYGSGNVTQADTLIKSSAYPNKNFWVTEVANIWDAFPFIGQGAAAYLVWEGYESVYNHAILAGRGTTPPNDLGNGPALLDYNPTSGTYTPVKAFYEHGQVFKFVPPGADRIAVSYSIANLTVYAFQHPPTGRLTIVGRSTSGGSVNLSGSLANLSVPALFEFYQTNGSMNFQRGADVTVNNGLFSVTVAPNAVFTLTGVP